MLHSLESTRTHRNTYVHPWSQYWGPLYTFAITQVNPPHGNTTRPQFSFPKDELARLSQYCSVDPGIRMSGKPRVYLPTHKHTHCAAHTLHLFSSCVPHFTPGHQGAPTCETSRKRRVGTLFKCWSFNPLPAWVWDPFFPFVIPVQNWNIRD